MDYFEEYTIFSVIKFVNSQLRQIAINFSSSYQIF